MMLALAGLFGFFVAGSTASLATGLMLSALVSGLAVAGHRGWAHAWLGSLVLAVIVTAYLGLRTAESGSVIAGAMAVGGLVTALSLMMPGRMQQET
jgi:membrane-bound metal-dependent hydrolase YbcI (DUF457 family)